MDGSGALKGFEIFPTRVYKGSLDKTLINKTLDLLGDAEKGSLFNSTKILYNPSFAFLHRAVLDCVQPAMPKGDLIGDWNLVSAWTNRQAPGEEGFGLHSHIDSFMSAVVYLKGEDMSLTFRDQARESQPPHPDNITNYGIVVRHQFNEDVIADVEPGTILVFPSYLLHRGNDNTGNVERISIAYNIMPSRKLKPDSLPWTLDLRL